MTKACRFVQLVGPYSADDNFTRPDSSSSLGGGGPVGRAWTAHSGVWGISSNKGYVVSGAADNVATVQTKTGKTGRVFARVTMGTDGPGVIFRAVNDQNYELFQLNPINGGQWYRRSGPTYTQIGSNIPFAGYSSSRVVDMEIIMNGTSLSCKVDGVAFSTVTEPDSTYHGNSRCGLRQYGANGALWHRFEAT